jgi:hypothetical protein
MIEDEVILKEPITMEHFQGLIGFYGRPNMETDRIVPDLLVLPGLNLVLIAKIYEQFALIKTKMHSGSSIMKVWFNAITKNLYNFYRVLSKSYYTETGYCCIPTCFEESCDACLFCLRNFCSNKRYCKIHVLHNSDNASLHYQLLCQMEKPLDDPKVIKTHNEKGVRNKVINKDEYQQMISEQETTIVDQIQYFPYSLNDEVIDLTSDDKNGRYIYNNFIVFLLIYVFI